MKRRLLAAVAGLVTLGIVTGLWLAGTAWLAWLRIERLPLDVESARAALAAPPGPVSTGATDSILLVATDSGAQGELVRADVIMLFVLSARDSPGPVLISLPRDLFLPDPCSGVGRRLGTAIDGCGDAATGPELLAVMVEDFTGMAVDHIAMFDYEGFREIVDQLGGLEVCVPNPVGVRPGGKVLIDAGCAEVDGATALTWMRSRLTLQLVGRRWQPMSGIGDLQRNQRQQEAVLALIEKVQRLNSPFDLRRLLRLAAGSVAVDNTLSLGKALQMARELQDLDVGAIRRIEVPVQPSAGEGGEFMFLPTAPVSALISAQN